MLPNKKTQAEQFPDVNRQGWNAEQISEESANQTPDEITRQMLRGDETKGSADDRDVAGGNASIDTPQGREETKKKGK